jgi:hypothetical protein
MIQHNVAQKLLWAGMVVTSPCLSANTYLTFKPSKLLLIYLGNEGHTHLNWYAKVLASDSMLDPLYIDNNH